MRRARNDESGKTKKTVGVIGLGIMGGSFSRNLVKAGWRVAGFDVDADKRKELAKAGVEIVGDAKAVAAAAPIVITSLPKPEALIATAKEIAEAKLAAPHHRRMLDLHHRGQGKGREDPARRRPRHARLPGQRHRLAGPDRRPGDLRQRRSKSVAKIKPMFAGFSRKMYDVGAFGNGSKMKYVANLLVAINNVASAEAMVLGMKAGSIRRSSSR